MANDVRQMRRRCLRANKECTDSLLEKLWIDQVDRRCAVGKASSSPGRASDTDMMNIYSMLRDLRGNPGIMTVRPTTLNLDAARRAFVGSVLTYGNSDWAGDDDRFSVSRGASWLRGKLGWCPIVAPSRNKSTTALSSGEAKLVAALSGACEGMGLRQVWNWLEQFGCNDDEPTEASQQIVCRVSSAALGVIRRKASTRKTRRIELKAFFLQQLSARPKMSFVQAGTSEMPADCPTKTQSTPNSAHLSKIGLEIKSSPGLV